jgi:hypothetical protein
MFIPQLAIDTEFFHSAFVKPRTMKNQRRSQSSVRLTAHLANTFNLAASFHDAKALEFFFLAQCILLSAP